MGGNLTSFVVAANAILNEGGRIVDANSIEDDPPPEAPINKKGKSSSSSYPKPQKDSRLKTIRRKK